MTVLRGKVLVENGKMVGQLGDGKLVERAIFDLIPVIGAYVGGAVVSLVALTVSLPVAVATLGFYVGYKLAEDYFIVPRVMGKTVQVPAVVALVAVLIGGTLLGIIGALVAIPAAAAIRLFLQEVVFRRLDTS
jgi:predicted PurR-regulated permease PerM